MTLSEITTEVRNITGVDSTSVLADSIIHDLINEGHFQLCDEANLLQGYATRNSVVDTSEYQMKDTNTLVTDWTLSQNNLDGAISTSLSLESMTRIYRVEYDGSICQRIGINEISDIPDDSSAVTILTEGAFLALIREAARLGVLENASFGSDAELFEADLQIKDEEIKKLQSELVSLQEKLVRPSSITNAVSS